MLCCLRKREWVFVHVGFDEWLEGALYKTSSRIHRGIAVPRKQHHKLFLRLYNCCCETAARAVGYTNGRPTLVVVFPARSTSKLRVLCKQW